MQPLQKLSVVIPAYNEEKRIRTALEQILKYFKDRDHEYEILVVNDGSTDQTAAVAREVLKGCPFQILDIQPNRGKGNAVKTGMLKAAGDLILFTDADLSTPIEEFDKFIRAHGQGYDVVIGSRDLPDSKVEVHQAPLRELMGKVFNLIARMLTFRGIHDSQCGFKSFTHAAARQLFSLQKIDGFSFDAELLYLCQRKGYRLLECPVTWRNEPQSRVRIVSDPIKMFLDLIRIRWIHRNL